jgi:hypothetical protein
MQIADYQADQSSLAAFGREAVDLLCSGDIPRLAQRFGYAVACGREPASAIRDDFASSLSELSASVAKQVNVAPTVRYFDANSSGLFAVVECRVPTDTGGEVLVELIVTSAASGKHIMLEQVSAA